MICMSSTSNPRSFIKTCVLMAKAEQTFSSACTFWASCPTTGSHVLPSDFWFWGWSWIPNHLDSTSPCSRGCPLIPALGRQRQEDLCEFHASLDYYTEQNKTHQVLSLKCWITAVWWNKGPGDHHSEAAALINTQYPSPVLWVEALPGSCESFCCGPFQTAWGQRWGYQYVDYKDSIPAICI